MIKKKNILLATVFFTGACVLVIEVVATRILSPYFGNTIFTFSSVISVILAALSLGYYIGGRVADRYPTLRLFYGIILTSGISVFFLHILKIFILPLVGHKLSLVNGPLIASTALFILPGFLLGMLSPFVIKLLEKNLDKEGIGRVSGEVFFWSTLGSIAGSLLAGFVLIPRLGINIILLSVAIMLSAIGLLGLHVSGYMLRRLIAFTLLIVVIVSLIISSIDNIDSKIVFEKDGIYERISIVDALYKDRPTRYLVQDSSVSGAMFLRSDEEVFDYSKYYKLYELFNSNAKDILLIGGGAYSTAKSFYNEIQDASIEVVEIEPILFELAKKYFKTPETSRIRNTITDGRHYLYNSDKEYDLIFADAYHSLFSVPTHLTTYEFLQLARSRLSQGGVLLANIIGDLNDRPASMLLSELKTWQAVFGNSYFFAVNSPSHKDIQNIIMVGYNSDEIIDLASDQVRKHEDGFIRDLNSHVIHPSSLNLARHKILTDDFSPVEYLSAQAIKEVK